MTSAHEQWPPWPQQLVRRQPSASDVATAASTKSPLDKFKLASPLHQQSHLQQAGPSRFDQPIPAPPVPTLDLNLFRSPSVYSIESTSSLDTISSGSGTEMDGDPADGGHQQPALVGLGYGHGYGRGQRYGQWDEDEDNDEDEDVSPSTPRAVRTIAADFFQTTSAAQSRAATPTTERPTGSRTPTRGFVVRSRPEQRARSSEPHHHPEPDLQPAHPYARAALRSAISDQPFSLRPVPGRTRDVSSSDDCSGSSSSTSAAAAATSGSSSSSRLVVPRDAPVSLQPETNEVPDWASVHGEQGSDWGDDEAGFEWLDTEDAPETAINGSTSSRLGMSPSKRLTRLRAAVTPSSDNNTNNSNTANTNGDTRDTRKKLKKPIVIPRRAAPPPPSGPGSPDPASLPRPGPGMAGGRHALSPRWANQQLPRSPSPDLFTPRLLPHIAAGPGGSPRTAQTTTQILPPRGHSLAAPTMVPLKDDIVRPPFLASHGRQDSRQSHLSGQSAAAYSFYDLDPTGLPPGSPSSINSMAFPHGQYTKVPASALERGASPAAMNGFGTADSPLIAVPGSPNMSVDTRSGEELVNAGIVARGNGDLPKSAWLFMKAAEAGSTTGRMYWGLSLRHGWGVARDERRAFTELLTACDKSLAEGGLDFHQSPGAVKLSVIQKKSLSEDLSLGLFEVANCFLQGVGVRRAPDVALQYLRMAGNMGDMASQEQLGLLLSKGSHGIKKDMKESAKWYRTAIAQGSNTFGLAWVWKDKYND